MVERPSPAPALRVATVGFQGFGNLGDEAILTGIEAALGDGVRAVAVFSGPRPQTIAAFPSAPRIVTWRHLPGIRAVRALRRADLLLLAGGGLFNDHWTGVIPRYCAWVLAARLAGARVAWVGVGVGPIRRGWLRAVARLAARMSHVVLVRDDESAALLGRSVRVGVVSDPAVFNDPPDPRRGDELGVVVRAPTPSGQGHRARLVEALAATAVAAAADGMRPVILTMGGPRDDPFAEEVRAATAAMGLSGVASEPLGPTPAAALDRLSCLSAAVTVRLHGLVLAALADVPAVAIAYDAKVGLAAERLGLGDLVVPLETVSGPTLSALVRSATTDARRLALRDRVAQLRDERAAVAAMVIAAGARP